LWLVLVRAVACFVACFVAVFVAGFVVPLLAVVRRLVLRERKRDPFQISRVACGSRRDCYGSRMGGGVGVQLLTAWVCLLALSTPASAGWFKTPCPKGPDGFCAYAPCEPFLDEMRALAGYRRQADDPGCPGHSQSSLLADQKQQSVDVTWGKVSTACIRKAAAIMRPVASIDVRVSYGQHGAAVAQVRYTNNTKKTVKDATIACSAMRDARAVAKGQGVAKGPIRDGATRDVEVRIDLGGEAFACVECELGIER